MKLHMSNRHIFTEKNMLIYEYNNITIFEFVCDLIIDNRFSAHFDDANVVKITDLLGEHNIENWQCTLGINESLQRTVKLEVHEPLPEPFHYDLSTLMLAGK